MTPGKIPVFIAILFMVCSRAGGQTYIHNYHWQVDTTIIVRSPDFTYTFPERHRPLEQSVQIKANNQSLTVDRDFRVINASAIIFFPAPIPGDTLRISYRREPFDLKRVYRLFTIDTLEQKRAADSLEAAEKEIRVRQIDIENPFEELGSDLRKSGSIMRGIRIGSNRDLTLSSGLNLELAGKLSDNVEVIAALTDESTPIQPEGNTQTLEEVDRVFVEFKSPYIGGIVGDLNLTYDKTQFSNLSRKLQGITLLGNYKQQYLGATVATTRGFFHRMRFIGQEGNQGPYQLTGKNGEREIIVLAGTERVWVNGQKMVRGESSDYVIEYGNGQITFTNRRLITSESRIEIDFEYFPAIQKFNRNAYSGLVGGEAGKGKLSYRASYYRENDNIGQVLGEAETLTETEKEVLAESGDNPLEAYTEGSRFVGDSLGNYTKIDTVIAGDAYSYYRYAGQKAGDYTVSFAFVGSGKGDYTRDRLGVYRWVGINKGAYLPRKLIPLPIRHELGDVQLKWNPLPSVNLETEWAHTRLDQNTLSGIDDNDNRGNALTLRADIGDQQLSLGKQGLGRLRMSMDSRFIEETFQSVDRFNRPDHQRFWNLLGDARTSSEERSLQFNSTYQPIKFIAIGGNFGSLRKSDFRSTRYSGHFLLDNPEWIEASAGYEFIGSRVPSAGIRNDWKRMDTEIKKTLWKLQPQITYQSEQRENVSPNIYNGFAFDEYGVGLGLVGFKYVSGLARFNKRFDQVFDIERRGELIPQAETQTGRMRLELQNIESTTASLELVKREKDYEKRFEEIKIDTLKLLYADAEVQDTVWQDRSTNLADLNLSHARWKRALNLSMQYRISTEQVALKEKVYLDVGEGRGNLRFDDDLDEYIPDPDGRFMLFVLPSGRFEPITNLQSAMRIQYDPGRYWREADGPLQNILTKISGESYFRVEEETKEPDLTSLYTLDLSSFQQARTLRGTIIYNQDLYFLRRHRRFSFRLQYRYRDDLFNQFLDPNENEDRLSIDRSLRFDWRITSRLKSQSEGKLKMILRESEANPTRNRDVNGYFYNQKFSFRPLSRWEFGLESELGWERNKAENYPLKLWFGTGRLRINYAIPGKTRISADYEYQQVTVTDNPQNLVVPFEMARGRKEGASKKWQIRSEYTVAKNIVFTFFYSGRDEAGFDRIIHSGQAEVRAFF